jgi:type II restriction enzyme
MNPQMFPALAYAYHSAAQRAGVITEAWAAANLYCVACTSTTLTTLPHNSRVYDFRCPQCEAAFQLKSSRSAFGSRIVDGAYDCFASAITALQAPNLLALHYDANTWSVSDLFVIPQFTLTLSCVEKRRPLSATARRAGWTGCNINLSNIPMDARIALIEKGHILSRASVRAKYRRIQPISRLAPEQRGWLLDVLTTVRSLQRRHFSLKDVYGDVLRLSSLHPENHHVEEKARQQLQRLRDLGFLQFLGNGNYELVES